MPFPGTQRFRKGLSIVSEIDISKLPKLVSRVAQKLGLVDETPFTDEEKGKLCEVLKLPADDLQLMLETLQIILRQAAYHNWKPSVLMQNLVSTDTEQEKSETLSQAWQKYGREIISRLKKQTLSVNQLESVGWHLNLQVAQGSKSKLAETNVVFQLETKGTNEEKKDLLIEFSHEELLAFYNKLEIIQEQMDALS